MNTNKQIMEWPNKSETYFTKGDLNSSSLAKLGNEELKEVADWQKYSKDTKKAE